MKKVMKTVLLLVGTLSISLGSVFMVFAKNTALGAQKISESAATASVDPYMAILATVIVGLVGVIAFAKRNFTK